MFTKDSRINHVLHLCVIECVAYAHCAVAISVFHSCLKFCSFKRSCQCFHFSTVVTIKIIVFGIFVIIMKM